MRFPTTPQLLVLVLVYNFGTGGGVDVSVIVVAIVLMLLCWAVEALSHPRFAPCSVFAGTLEINSNRALRSIGGAFSSLEYAGHVRITSNSDLRALNALVFPALVDVGQYYTGAGLQIYDNPHLVGMNGAFAALVSVYRLSITSNAAQQSYRLDQGNGMLPALQCFWGPVGLRMCTTGSNDYCARGARYFDYWQGPHRFGRDSGTPYMVTSDNQCDR